MKSKEYSNINVYILLTFSLRNLLNEKNIGGKHKMKNKRRSNFDCTNNNDYSTINFSSSVNKRNNAEIMEY